MQFEIDDYSQLAPEHRAFIERWARMTSYGSEREIVHGAPLEVDGKRLTRIFAGKCTLDPTSKGALDVTFWRADDGSYWFVHAGGCIAFRSVLYGPY